MLTSTNQYLKSEYLTPLPTTLDSKKSPLALLAQTCSQIGADTPNLKLLQASDKSSSKKSDGNKEKSMRTTPSILVDVQKSLHKTSPELSEERSSSTGGGSGGGGGCGSNHRDRTPSSNHSSMKNGQRCGSNQSSTSTTRESPNVERKSPDRRSTTSKSPEKLSSDGSSSPNKTAFTQNIFTSSSDPAIKDLPLGTFKPGMPPVSSAFLNTGVYTFPPITMDLMTSNLLARNSALNPYLYGRLKAADPLSVCRDPYCTGMCSVSSHLLSAQKLPGPPPPPAPPPCPAGCSQCDHPKIPTPYSSAAAAYAQAHLAALAAATPLPYVCNWVSSDATYCGKRFTNSDDLLAHLRTHTSAVNDANSNLSLLTPPAIPAATHPLLHRYPTPPLSPRYHPYSKTSFLPPPPLSAAYPGLGHPAGFPQYLNPYAAFYGGPRLGAATPSMHP